MIGGLFLYGGPYIVNCAIKDASGVAANMGTVVGYDMIQSGKYDEVVAIVSAKLPIKIDDEYKPYSLKEFFTEAGMWDSFSPMLLEITETEYYNLE
jgi:hypothetical protein